MRSIHTHAHTYLKIVPNTLLYKTFQICSFLSVMYFALFHFMIDCSLTNHWLLMYLNFQVESIGVWKRKVSGIILFFFFLHRTWTGDSFHTWYYTCFNAILPNLPTLSLSHRVHKTDLCIGVSFAVSYTGLLLPSF